MHKLSVVDSVIAN